MTPNESMCGDVIQDKFRSLVNGSTRMKKES